MDKFGTYLRDGTGLDYADQRYLSGVSGRFLSADPYEASGSAANPGTWGRYGYVGGDPANFRDPTGLLMAPPGDDIWGGSGGGGGGGAWCSWIPFFGGLFNTTVYAKTPTFKPDPNWQTPAQVQANVSAWDRLIASSNDEDYVEGEVEPWALKLIDDCYKVLNGSVERRRRYQVIDRMGRPFSSPGTATVNERIYIQSGQLQSANASWGQFGANPLNGLAQFDDNLSGNGTTLFQQFTISVPWMGIANSPIQVFEPNRPPGNQTFGTLGIRIERGVVFINGNDGKINGQMPRCGVDI